MIALIFSCVILHAQAPAPDPATQPNPANAAPSNAASADFAQLGRYRQANADLLRSKSAIRVVFLGDSITDRWGREAGQWFPHPGWINRGIGGQTTAQMLLRIRSDVLDLNAQAVVLEGGANDMRLGFTPEEISDNIATMGELAQVHGTAVYVVDMLPVCDCYRPLTGLRTPDRIARLNHLLLELCRQKGWTFIDWNPALTDDHNLMRQAYTSDGVHPNEEGYHLLAPFLERALERYHQ